MPIALVSNVKAAPGANGGTTGSIDTTGATLLAVVVATWQGGTDGTESVTDNKGNTYSKATLYPHTSSPAVRLFYCVGGTVGSGHTFTYSDTNSYAAILATAWSGTATSSAFDQENGSNTGAAGTSRQPGSVTPTEDNELLISGLCWDGSISGLGIDSSFTLLDSQAYSAANNMGGAVGYKIQTTAGAENPTWSWTSSVFSAADIATFKAAAPAGRTTKNTRSHPLGVSIGTNWRVTG